MALNDPFTEIRADGLAEGDLRALKDLAARAGFRVVDGEAKAGLVVVDRSALEDGRLAGLCAAGAGALILLDRSDAASVAPALQAGALDCLAKPLDAAKVARTLERCARQQDLRARMDQRREQLRHGAAASMLVGESAALRSAVALAVQAAAFPVDLLILGETGTGKEMLARVVHENSGRRAAPFVAVDCGAINDDLAESELFGHRRGAFTGAVEDRAGLMRQAQGGTLFLDEVANLSLGTQAKLLRALQNREIWPLGESNPEQLDLRVVAATNADLPALAAQGRFRLDLYHRLEGLQISVPPLRRRGDDILLLARLFLARHRERFGKGPCELSEEARVLLRGAAWPGNVRQLDNCMKQAALFSGDRVEAASLPAELAERRAEGEEPARTGDLPEGVLPLRDLERAVTRQVETRLIREALRRAGNDREQAALSLGLHPKTLGRKLKEIEP